MHQNGCTFISELHGAGLNDISDLPRMPSVFNQGTEAERVRRLFRGLMQTLNEHQTNQEALNGPTIVVFIDRMNNSVMPIISSIWRTSIGW